MAKVNILTTSQVVAESFAAYLFEGIQKSSIFHLALSGGSTPKLLFAFLTEQYIDKIDWEKLQLYWGDERCVSPDDGDSNFKMTNDLLLSKVPIPESNIHRIMGEANPEQEAKRYAKLIEKNLPSEDGIPVFDLVILGMGADGHTASIFPNQMELLESENTCEVATHPESGQHRITLTGPVINAAKEKHLLVTGASKRAVLKKVFSKTDDYKSFPVSYVEQAEWWLALRQAQEPPFDRLRNRPSTGLGFGFCFITFFKIY